MSSSSKKSKTKSRIRIAIGLLISIACIWWVLGSVDIAQVGALLRKVDRAWFTLALVSTVLSYFLRSWRWSYFFSEKAPSLYDSYRCLNAGFFMNNVLPARIGELVRAHLGGRVTGQSRSVVLATIAAERLADGLCISFLFLASITLIGGAVAADKVSGLYWVAVLFFFAFLMTIGLLLMRDRVFSFLEKTGNIMPGHLSRYTLLRVRRFIEGLEPLLEPLRLLTLGVFSLAVWGIELFAYYCVVQAFGQSLSFANLVLFLTVVNFSSLIPAAPGGVGVIEAVATMVLTRVGLDSEVALSMVATQHLIQYLVVGIPGAYFFTKFGGGLPEDEVEDHELVGIQQEGSSADVSGSSKDSSDNISKVAERAPAEPELPEIEEQLVEISVVIPAFNEQYRLPKTLLSVLEYLKENYETFEIIVVDDGSSDQTPRIVRQFESLAPEVKLFVLPRNRGKGYAVKFGVLNSLGRRVLYNDADGASPIEELARLQIALSEGADVAIGSRARYSVDTEVDTVFYRKLMGRVFNGIVNLVILPGIADTQCGFKLFQREAAMAVFKLQRSEGFSFDVELLFLARKADCKIVEIPINWTNVPGSKVNLGRDSMLMFKDIFVFRLRDILGGYGSSASLQEASRSTES